MHMNSGALVDAAASCLLALTHSKCIISRVLDVKRSANGMNISLYNIGNSIILVLYGEIENSP